MSSVQGDGDARSEMEELLWLIAARGGGEREANGADDSFEQSRASSRHGQHRQDARGAWQREQKTSNGWQTCSIRFLKTDSYCSSHSDDLNRLTARLQRVNTAKPLIHCKNCVHEKCRPTIHLQLLFKDHRLILHGSEVTSSQSWLDPTETGL